MGMINAKNRWNIDTKAMIILDDANIDLVLPIAVEGAFGDSGMGSTSIKRFIVQDAIADKFIARFIQATRCLQVGEHSDFETDISPFVSVDAADMVQKNIRAAVAAGADLRYGGQRRGALLWPVVLDRVDVANPINVTSALGPVALFIRVKDIQHAIRITNEMPSCASSGVFTNNANAAAQAKLRIQSAEVAINKSPNVRMPKLPFFASIKQGFAGKGITNAIAIMQDRVAGF